MSYNTRKKLKGTFFILPAFLIHVIVIVIPALSMIPFILGLGMALVFT